MYKKQQRRNLFLLIFTIMSMAFGNLDISLAQAHGGEKHDELKEEAAHDQAPAPNAPSVTRDPPLHTDHPEILDASSQTAETWPRIILWSPPLHPFMAHFAIAFLMMAGVVSLITLVKKTEALFKLALVFIYLGTISALLAVGSGLYFEAYVPHRHGGLIDPVMAWHERLGIAVGIGAFLLSCLIFLLKPVARPWNRKFILTGVVLLALLALSTGRLGAILVHYFGVGLP